MSKYSIEFSEPFFRSIKCVKECWRDVVGYEGAYRVSSWGRVKSLPRTVKSKWGSTQDRPGKMLSCPISKSTGYPLVGLSFLGKGKRKQYSVHVLVLEAFVGPCPEGMMCRHFPDNDRTNVRLDNLQWGTYRQNQKDREVHGTDSRGEKSTQSKLTEAEVLEIRRIHKERRKAGRKAGVNIKNDLAVQFKVTPFCIDRIICRYSWKHI